MRTDFAKQHIERSEEMIRKNWFPKHRADKITYPESTHLLQSNHLVPPTRPGPIEFLLWGQPGTSNCRVHYYFHASTLMVTGDLGSATYRWSYESDMNMEWVSKLNLDYFAGKTETLQGRGQPKQWDSRVAVQRGIEWFNEEENKQYLKEIDDWQSYISSKEEWANFLAADSNPVFDTRSPLIEAGASEWGDVLDIRCIGHWLGLKLAFEALNGGTNASHPQVSAAPEALAQATPGAVSS